MNVLNRVVQAVSVGVNAEINELRIEAHGRIHAREVARAFINRELLNMPVLVGGEHMVGYKDKRGDKQAKQQQRNLSLWTVALQTVIERGNTSFAHLGNMFVSWAKETLGVAWDIQSAKRTAKLFVYALQDMEIVDRTFSDFEYIDENNMPAVSRVFMLQTSFEPVYNKLYDELCVNAHYVCRPLYNQPEDWVDNFIGVGEQAGLRLIKGSGMKYVAKDVLRAVNRLQAVQFMIPDCVIETAHDMLDNQHEFTSTPEELMMYAEVLKYANTKFYFPVTMDKRGRMYYRGGLLSPQGTDFCKSAFQFVEFKPLGETGLDAVCVHLANQLGYDKLSIDMRISSIREHIDAGDFDLINDHVDVRQVFPKASVFQSLVAILELKRILAIGGDPALVESNLVCHQDGTCNGLQHMSAITYNRQTAETVNCTESTRFDVPQDIYGIVASYAREFASPAVVHLLEKYGRDMAKNPVMITGYGAGEDTIKANIAVYLREHGESDLHADEIGDCYIASINKNAGAVKALTAALKSRTKEAMKHQDEFKWQTADGFRVAIEYKDYEPARVRAGKFNALLRNVECARDDVKTVGAMAPNFIHSIDATHLRMVINNCDWDLVTVHDSIGSHPCNFFDTNHVIREQFVAVHEYDAMDNLCANMKARKPKFRGDYNAVEALESTYIFS